MLLGYNSLAFDIVGGKKRRDVVETWAKRWTAEDERLDAAAEAAVRLQGLPESTIHPPRA